MSGVSMVVVAAGSGERLRQSLGGGPAIPRKALFPVAGQPLIAWTLRALRQAAEVDEIVVVMHADDAKDVELCGHLKNWGATAVVAGGARRQDSVLAGLLATKREPDRIVGVHDAARPLVSREELHAVFAAARDSGAALLAAPVRDTVKRGVDGFVSGTIPRESVFLAQTPQVAKRSLLERALLEAGDVTDEAMALEAIGVLVRIVPGLGSNRKLTTAEDLAMIEWQLGAQTQRVGHGYDLHRLVVGRPLMIGGIAIPFERGSLGHSDGDVALHALVDAMLGAAGLGDIGELFPDTDPSFAGAASSHFVLEARRRVEAAGYAVHNADLTIHAERPKLAPHKASMRAHIAELLGLGLNQVNIKATTHEGVGAIGSGEAISATALVTLSARRR